MILNEELLEVNGLEGEEVKDTIEAVKPDYAAARNEYIKNKKNIKDRFKDQIKDTKKFLKDMDVKPIKGILDENLFEAAVEVEEESTLTPGDIYYPKTRDPLADIIQAELSDGEYAYKVSKSGNLSPANVNGIGIDYNDIGVDSDSNGYFVKAYVTEDKTDDAVNIAKKYGKDYELGEDKFVSGNGKYIKIYVDEEDFDKPYFDPNAKIKPSIRRSKLHK